MAFLALRVLPGDAIQGQLLQTGVSLNVIEQRRREQGLNDPLWLQYCRYMLHLIQGDLGYSLLDGQFVNDMIVSQILPTVELGVTSIFIAIALGLTLGVLSAISAGQGRVVCNTLITLSLSMPIYWTGTLAILVFSEQIRLFPVVGAGSVNQLILPASVLGFHSAGAIAVVVRANINEVTAADFVRTAHAKGLPPFLILRRHILRAALLPTITVITIQMGFLLSGAVITESLFVRPGIGRLLLDRTLKQDYPVVQGIVVMAAVVSVLLNSLANLIYRLVDPRISVP